MATCGSLHHLFEKPLPENPTLLESLSSWNKIKPINQVHDLSSLTEIFGELHFKVSPSTSSPCPPPHQEQDTNIQETNKNTINMDPHKENQSLDDSPSPSPKKIQQDPSTCLATSLGSLDSLQLCTEGLGLESSDEVETSANEREWRGRNQEKKSSEYFHDMRSCSDVTGIGNGFKRGKATGKFPPPISCIGAGGKPCFSFKSFRHDGRFVLTEIKIPSHEILHASREDGRLKLHIASVEEFIEEDQDEGEDEDGAQETNEQEQEQDHEQDHKKRPQEQKELSNQE